MTTMRQLLLATISLSTFGTSVGFAQLPCPVAPLAVYTAPGFACTEGVFTFKSFTFQSSNEGQVPPQSILSAAAITVIPLTGADQIGLRFEGNFSSGRDETIIYQINYFIDPPPPVIRGEQISIDPATLITVLCSTNTVPCPDDQVLGFLEATTAQPTASVIFPQPVNMMSVQNTLILDGLTQANGIDNATLLTSPVFSQNLGPEDAYQIHPLSNLNIGDGVINITNTGALGAEAFGPLAGTTGRICVNVYTFAPDEQEISCCSCLVTPNALVHLSGRADLIGNTATGAKPDSVVVKLVASIPASAANSGGTNAGPFDGSTCNPASPLGAANLAPGMLAWATSLHPVPTNPVSYRLTEERFEPAVLSPLGELDKLTVLCRFIVGNGGGAGVCKTCTLGGLGAGKQ